MSKTSVLQIVTDHLDTLRDSKTDRPAIGDYVLLFGVPIGIGVVVGWKGPGITDVGQIIAGSAVLVGFTFGLIVYVFQLRVEVTRDPRVPKGRTLTRLIDELFANLSYTVIAGLVAVAAPMVAAAFRADGTEPLGPWWTGAVLALMAHFILDLGMCLKRTHRAYHELSM